MEKKYKLSITRSNRICIPRWLYSDVKNYLPSLVGLDINYIYYDMDHLSQINTAILEAYWACNWYPLLKDKKIPVIKSKIVEGKSLEELIKKMGKYISSYKYVRTCNASPRDVCDKPIFGNVNEAYDILVSSPRVSTTMDKHEHFHVFMRKPFQIHNESRCFFHQRILRAVSLPDSITSEKESQTDNLRISITCKILSFFEKYGESLPYSSSVIDLSVNTRKDNKDVVIIKINPYHYDVKALKFDWIIDKEILFNSKSTQFK